MRLGLAVGLLAALVAPSTARAGGSHDGGNLPPITVPGSRQVSVRNETGGLSTFYSIPSLSVFRRHGGTGQPCTFTARTPGTASDGQTYVTGQVVSSGRWIFREGTAITFEDPNPTEPALTRGPLAGATRDFFVFCDRYDANHSIGFVQVGARDPLLDPRPQLTKLYNLLQLERPVVYRNPVIDEWGGLITRYPAWLAIQPAAWQPGRSDPAYYRGWTLYLLTNPAALEFQLTFTPNPDRPSPAFNGIVPCVPAGTTPTPDAVALPAVPQLPEQTEPGVNGPCEWTPPGPGTVTIQARITYTVTLWANGYTEPQADYAWTSNPVTYDTGELAAVNVNG